MFYFISHLCALLCWVSYQYKSPIDNKTFFFITMLTYFISLHKSLFKKVLFLLPKSTVLLYRGSAKIQISSQKSHNTESWKISALR
jgi:hypothetical protein